jgi:hypothetical protein
MRMDNNERVGMINYFPYNGRMKYSYIPPIMIVIIPILTNYVG